VTVKIYKQVQKNIDQPQFTNKSTITINGSVKKGVEDNFWVNHVRASLTETENPDETVFFR
jgi:hypothetical protein